MSKQNKPPDSKIQMMHKETARQHRENKAELLRSKGSIKSANVSAGKNNTEEKKQAALKEGQANKDKTFVERFAPQKTQQPQMQAKANDQQVKAQQAQLREHTKNQAQQKPNMLIQQAQKDAAVKKQVAAKAPPSKGKTK